MAALGETGCNSFKMMLSDTVSTLQSKNIFLASYCGWWPGADTALRNSALSAHGRQSRWRSVVQLAGAMIISCHDMQHQTRNDVNHHASIMNHQFTEYEHI